MRLTSVAPVAADVAPAANGPNDARQAILDTALDLGDRLGWDAVHLHEVARCAGVTLAEIRRHFEHKDALAEAWFDHADAALLAMPQTPGWSELSPRMRLHAAIAAWLAALAPHRKLAPAMLRYKFHPEHVHLQALGIMRISRTVQWIRDVALLPETGWRREIGEAGLTSIYLATFARWLADDSPGTQKSLALLDRLLAAAERAALRIGS
jgi:AcrR family transcriptional regulator